MTRIALFGDLGTVTAGREYDGLLRAFEHFGHPCLPIDVRAADWSFEQTEAELADFGASLWWVRAKEGLVFLTWYCQRHPKPETVVYHFVDLRAPEGVDSDWPIKRPVINPESVHGLIDVLFLVNTAQLSEYQLAYQIPSAYFLPQFYVPDVLHPLDIPKTVDVGFVGGMSHPLHKRRTEVLLRLQDYLGSTMQIVQSGCYGSDLAEFYSQCKIVIGMCATNQVAHYSSDRMVYALGCGAFYLAEYFAGFYDLMPQGTAVAWLDFAHLVEQVRFWLVNNELRETVARRGHNLALEQYTHIAVIGRAFELLRGEHTNA